MSAHTGVFRALEVLLDCSTVAPPVPPSSGELATSISVRSPLRKKTRGRVDLALCHADDLPSSLRPEAVAGIGTSTMPGLGIGDHGALWRPGLSVGLSTDVALPKASPGILLVAQRRTTAAHLLAEAEARGVPVVAAIATGSGRGGLWRELTLAALSHAAVGTVVVAQEEPAELDDVATCARQASHKRVLLYVADDAQHLDTASLGQLPDAPRADAVAKACGMPCLETPAQLLEAARHVLSGLEARSGRVLPLIREPAEAPVLERYLRRAGLEPAMLAGQLSAAGLRTEGAFVIAPSRQHLLSRALRRARPLDVDALVCLGRVPRALDVEVPQLFVGPYFPGAPARAVDETALAALGALLQSPTPPRGPAAVTAKEPAHSAAPTTAPTPLPFGEAEAKALARRHGLESVDERVVSSATAASKAAAALEPPLTVRPVGPGLGALPSPGLQRLQGLQQRGVDSAAAARQAFRDVLFACAELYPDEPIEGVVVSEEAPPGLTLDCLLLFPAGLPLARLSLLHGEPGHARGGSARWLRLPASAAARRELADSLAQQAHSASRLTGAGGGQRGGRGRDDKRGAAELRRLLGRIDRLAVEAAAGLRWLSLSPLAVPRDGAPSRLVGARGERRWQTMENNAQRAKTRP